MSSRTTRMLIFAAVLAAATAWAGGSGLNVLVVVNQNSTNSVQLGNDYCALRGVPPQNVLRLTNWTGGSIQWSLADFQTQLLNPLRSAVSSRGLTNQVQFVVLSMDIPYRVTFNDSQNSTTSALFYGFKTNDTDGLSTCSLPDNSSNSYAYSEMPFGQAPPNTAVTNSFLAMMLTDTNLATAENTLCRGVAADFSYPTQMVCLVKTTDVLRNVRFVEFDNSVFENQVASNFAVVRIDPDTPGFDNLFGVQATFTNLFGVQTGWANYTLYTNAFVPGALGDTLTSFAGEIFDSGSQTSTLAFLEAGASGTYGTVVEPCNYTQKFPDPVDYFYQARGFSVAEAYYQSVLNPFEGLFVGEPLAAPFARPGGVSWSSLTNGSVLRGTAMLNPAFTGATTNLPLAQADLFVDGTWNHRMTNLPPAAGNVLSVTLNSGSAIHYTVPTNATLAGVASGLAGVLNLQSNVTHVLARAVGDRIELQSLDVFVAGSNVTASAGAAVGWASNLTTHVQAARPAFLDTIATGYDVVTVTNPPLVGDWIQASFIKTNGATVTLAVTNTSPVGTVGTMMQDLVNLINTNPVLQSADGVVAGDYFDADPYGESAAQFFAYARKPGWPASQILVLWTTSTNLLATPAGMVPLADNVNDLRPKNHLYVRAGMDSLAVNDLWDTTQVADGWHQLTAVGYEGTSVATQTRVTRTVQVQNTSLSAVLAALPAGTNATLGQSLQFTVTANLTNIARIELFSTGGSLGAVSNQATAVFVVSSSYLGQGLHPFCAVVTAPNGNRYQTATVWYELIPLGLTLTQTPPMISWPAIPNRQYELQSTTNLAVGFQTVATLTATNSAMQWLLTPTNRAAFYRVRLDL